MRSGKPNISAEELESPFTGALAEQFPPILTPLQLAALLHLSRKTIYQWKAAGRLDGAFRKRGKHLLFWRDRALDLIFNGKDWPNGRE
jgi:hypothetical protein